MDKGKAVMTHDQSCDKSSDSVGFTVGSPGERLNMPRLPMARAMEQIEADREFAEKRWRRRG